MKIAAISITQNDGYKFKEWCEHYEEYKEVLYLHIIVDNASEPEYLQQVKDYYKDSIVIERNTNGGCTGAYNDGIAMALKDPEVDAIMLVGNDVRIRKEDVVKLYDFLYSNDKYGMVSPVLLTPNSSIIECYGSQLNWIGVDKRPFVGLDINDPSLPLFREAEYVTGGMNLSKRAFYEKVGLQDDKLFMYADELDMYCRAKKNGFVEAVTKEAQAYHCHINPGGVSLRRPEMYVLHARNVVYLYRKHYPKTWFIKFLVRFCMACVPVILHPTNKEQRAIFANYCKGYKTGIKGNMDNSFVE